MRWEHNGGRASYKFREWQTTAHKWDTSFCKQSLLGTRPGPFICVLPWQLRHYKGKLDQLHQSLKYLLPGPFLEKFTDPCPRGGALLGNLKDQQSWPGSLGEGKAIQEGTQVHTGKAPTAASWSVGGELRGEAGGESRDSVPRTGT